MIIILHEIDEAEYSRCSFSMMVKWENDGLLKAYDGKMLVNDGGLLVNDGERLVNDGGMVVNDGEMSVWSYTGLELQIVAFFILS